VLVALTAIAACKHSEPMAWDARSAEYGSSQIDISTGDKTIASYDLDCDLSQVSEGPIDEEDGDAPNSVDVVFVPAINRSVFLVGCHVGAHSRRISILDPMRDVSEPVFVRTGLYLAYWQVDANTLWITHDTLCVSASCDENHETIVERWPAAD
jgi:hypothetical protein